MTEKIKFITILLLMVMHYGCDDVMQHAIAPFLQILTSVSTIPACMMPIAARIPLEVMSAIVHQTTQESIAK